MEKRGSLVAVSGGPNGSSSSSAAGLTISSSLGGAGESSVVGSYICDIMLTESK